MQVQTALLFESIEQIYERVFRVLKPRTHPPRVTVVFRKYANANSRITLEESNLKVYISDLLQGAPAPIQEALAFILISKLFGKSIDPNMSARYRRYLNRAEVRRVLHLVKQERGRKAFLDPNGRVYDLSALFDELNLKYFHGLMARPQLGWSMKPSRTMLGHWDPSHNAIVISSILDSGEASELVVKFILYHEMLHLKYPVQHKGARRCIHTGEFKKAEREFDRFEQAKADLKWFVEKTLRSG